MEQKRKDLFYVNYDIVKPKPFIPRPLRINESITDTPEYNSEKVYVQNECYDFHYILSGNGLVSYNGKNYNAGPGQGFLCHSKSNDIHYKYPENGDEPWHFISFTFMQDNFYPTYLNIINSNPVFTIPQNVHIINLLINNLTSKKRIVLSCAEGANIVYELLITLLRYSAESEKKEFHPVINKAESIIKTRIAKNISVMEIADELGVSREYLSRIFREYTGEKLKEYISKERIKYACNFLINTDKSIGEIAGELNYNTSSNFSRDFIHVMGITPGEYRRLKKYGSLM